MKKVIFFGGCLVLLYLLMRAFPEPTLLEIVEGYEQQWGVLLPEPQRYEQIWAPKSASHGDGEWASVLHYEHALPQPTAPGFIQITESNEAVIAGKVNRFITDSIATNLGQQDTQQQIRAAFDSTPVEFAHGDYYFYKAKNDGNDYLIGIYRPSENTVYLLKWHQ